jgi:ATP-dependent DNA helicase RecQ
MHDQIRSANGFGIRAASLTSADSEQDRQETLARLKAGDLDLLYVAPERASGGGFRELAARTPLSLIAVDEAHCVSEWGHDFRPDYRLLKPLLDAFPHVPRLALTATADRQTRGDILKQLGIPDDGLIVAGFDRPNIRYHVRPRDGVGAQLKALLAEQPGAGIVYVQSRDKAERLAEQLGGGARRVLPYHAGLDPQVRSRNQHAFVSSEDMVMVAPSPSAWASTSPTSASSPMPACRNRSRPITRRPAAPAATAIRPRPGCSGGPRISPAPAGASRPKCRRTAAPASASASTRWRR